MKHFFSLNTILLALAAILITTSASFAATYDYYLKIEGVDGEAKGFTKIIFCDDGSCKIGDLKVGQYKITVCTDAGGMPVAKDAVSGSIGIQATKCAAGKHIAQATIAGREASTPSVSEIVSPRDPASGLPTGKRMHKPFVITKELDKMSPSISFIVGPADLDGDGFFDMTVNKKHTKTGHVTLLK